jgi:hypothetical protein
LLCKQARGIGIKINSLTQNLKNYKLESMKTKLSICCAFIPRETFQENINQNLRGKTKNHNTPKLIPFPKNNAKDDRHQSHSEYDLNGHHRGSITSMSKALRRG